MRLTDSPRFVPTGRFLLKVFRAGQLVDLVDEANLVVDNSKQIHAQLIGGNVSNNSVTQIAFGTNGTAPVGGNTSITGAYTKSLDSVTYPATGEVSFNFSLGTGEDNGMAILEFGLLTAAGTLFARKVRSVALNKASDISLTGAWTIQY